MLPILKQIFNKSFSHFAFISDVIKKNSSKHTYRVVSIEQGENDEFIAVIQIINKKEIFRMHPEEILKNDALTDLFSQRDIRTLTYLGYLGINSPKYKILAKRLCENDSKLMFAIRERGSDKTIVKTAMEIAVDENLLLGLNQRDAQMVGYVMANEQMLEEEKQKKYLREVSQNE